jgi:hypothetical protein
VQGAIFVLSSLLSTKIEQVQKHLLILFKQFYLLKLFLENAKKLFKEFCEPSKNLLDEVEFFSFFSGFLYGRNVVRIFCATFALTFYEVVFVRSYVFRICCTTCARTFYECVFVLADCKLIFAYALVEYEAKVVLTCLEFCLSEC